MSEDKDELTDLTTGSPEEENDAHSNYQPETSPHDSITHHLSGMYQNWFLDYASYVILERPTSMTVSNRYNAASCTP